MIGRFYHDGLKALYYIAQAGALGILVTPIFAL